MDRTYIAIDLKSFYASVECVERNLDPLSTNLVVADAGRTTKTICLAVSPSLKAHGIPGRPRLFEVVQKVAEANFARKLSAPGRSFIGTSSDANELRASPELAIDYIVARPQMARYIEVSTRIYDIYLKYVAPEDIHVYSIDEVMMDVTGYLAPLGMTAKEFTMKIILEVLEKTGITATAGIGTNLFLAKVAMDIEAKHIPADENGVRIAELDEMSYRRSLWTHRPLTDFWRVGRGYATKLEAQGLYTMGDIARCSMGKPTDADNEGLLYRLFGINAELLIDHAWGWEPCTMADIKGFKPNASSVGSGQVLPAPYPYERAKLIVLEMTDLLVLDLVEKGLVTDQVGLSIGYDVESLRDPVVKEKYRGKVTVDQHGRSVPKHVGGSAKLGRLTSSTKLILKAMAELFDRIMDPNLLVRRIAVSAGRVVKEVVAAETVQFEQMDLFTDYEAVAAERAEEQAEWMRERQIQKALLMIKGKYGRSAVMKGMNLQEGGMTIVRNKQIGGHRA